MPMTSTLPAGHQDWLPVQNPGDLRDRTPEGAGETGQPTEGRRWIGHPIDIRLSVPLPFGRYYITLVAGPERRSAARRAEERQHRRLASIGNVLFVLASVGLFYAVLMTAALVLTLVLE